jgi:hypothetical protein
MIPAFKIGPGNIYLFGLAKNDAFNAHACTGNIKWNCENPKKTT